MKAWEREVETSGWRSDGYCQRQKEMYDHLLACQLFLKESHIVTRLANERALFLNMNDINDISIFERLTAIIVVLQRKRILILSPVNPLQS
jgi:hypothetical protein